MCEQEVLPVGQPAGTTEGYEPDMTPTLIARLRGGDTQAGGMLDTMYREAMIRFCRGYLDSIEEAEDAVQDVFCKVLATTQVPDNFRAWLYRIARNHCLNMRRNRGRRKDRQVLPDDSDFDATWTGHLTRLVHSEQRSHLVRLVASLPDANREALRLRYAEGLSRRDIAEVLGIPESVVKSRLFEGVKRLREGDVLGEV